MISTRLHYQLYVTIFLALSLFVVATIGLWKLSGRKNDAQIALESFDSLDRRHLLSADSEPHARHQTLDELSKSVGVGFSLYGADSRLIDSVGAVDPDSADAGSRATIGIRLRNGSWIEVGGFSQAEELFDKATLVVPLGALIAALCYPLVRRLTRRLERLQTSVEALGSGDLSARVKVEGRDEVSRLAQSFNSAAAQIEKLVGAHRLLLANVSHELRTPLARLRLTAELLEEVADSKHRAELKASVAEIDGLIEQILLSSRLEAVRDLDVRETVDMLALAAEEGSRCTACDVTGASVAVRGDSALLRRMVRNLIENAQNHGSPPIEVRAFRRGRDAVLTVSDGGDGIPAAEQERVFEPFYRPRGTRSQGVGLGLALVRQIARQHGGEAVVNASLPSTIEVRLPATA